MLPQLKVEASFTADPRLSPTWTDISAYVYSASIRRGRQHELDRFEAGEATVTVDNRDHRFYPFNAGSPYYPYVVPDRRLRISAVYGGVSFPLFSGYVGSWPQEREGFNDYFGEVTVTDAFKVLSLNRVTGSFASQRSDLRIHAILDQCDWQTGSGWILEDAVFGILGSTTIPGPVADRHIVTGISTMQAADLEDESALQHLQLVQQSENGLMFIGKDGEFRFYGRHAKLSPPFTEVQAIFSDNGEELWYSTLPSLRKYPYVSGSLKLRYDDTNLWTKISATRPGGIRQYAEDPQTGDIKYWHRAKVVDVDVIDDNEVSDLTTYLLSQYNFPKMRAEAMGVDGEYLDVQNDLWPLILARELGDRIRVEYTPKKPNTEQLIDYADPTVSYVQPEVFYRGYTQDPASTLQLIQDSFIEGIQIDIDCSEEPAWETSFSISPTELQTYWILDDPTASQLGVTTRLTY